jgi:3-(3-hydroxy-phenyl)propionate hydroxylase
MRPDYDVVIAGFGPTGAMAANLLAQHNIKTLVVDPQTEIYDIPRGVHFDGETMRIFQSIGIADAVMAQSASNETVEFVNGRGASLMLAALDEVAETAGWPTDIFFRQPLVEKNLRDNLAGCEAIDYQLGWRLEALKQEDTQVTMTLRCAETDAAQTITAAYLIGADGADSAVRRLADIALKDLKCDEPWLVVDWELDPGVEFARNVYQFCDPKRPGTLVPCAGQHIRWEFMMNPGDKAADMENQDAVRTMMRPYLYHLGPDIKPEDGHILRSKVYEFHALLAERMSHHRVFLMGDAAHQMPPFLGQGMCAGLRDAENLIWKLAGVLRSQYAPALLETYHSERYAHVQAVIKQAVQIGEIIQTRNPVKAFLRDSFLRLGKLIPPLISGIQFGITWRLGKGLLADELTAGWQIPQSWVHKNGARERLDAFLPRGFCVLALDNSARVELQTVSDAYPALACPIFTLGHDFSAEDTLITDMAASTQSVGFLLRPDRQIYATLKVGKTSLAEQLEQHMQALSGQLLAEERAGFE